MESLYEIMNLIQPLVDFDIIDSSISLIVITTIYMAVNFTADKISRHREAKQKAKQVKVLLINVDSSLVLMF